jgi:cytochrome c
MTIKKIIFGASLALITTTAMAKVNLGACLGCHGANFERKALGKSLIVKNMTKQAVSDSMVGYKNGTYGGPMKGLMKNQVAKYSEAELRSTGLGKEDVIKENFVNKK